MQDQLHYFSVIIPIFNAEETVIKELYLRLKIILDNLNQPYEIIFVDDGSINDIFVYLKSLAQKDSHLKVIRLLKNYGQMAAYLAGFEYSSSEIIITMDADLQCIPEDIPLLIKKVEEGFDLCGGYRKKRCDPLIRKVSSDIMNKIMRVRTQTNVIDWGCTFMAMRREIVEQFKFYGQQIRYIKFLVIRTNKKFIEVPVNHYPITRGTSSYTIISLIGVALDFICFFSFKPRKKGKAFYKVKEVFHKIYVRT